MLHSLFHLLRWCLNNDVRLLWTTTTGVTGMIAAFVTPFIVWPMVITKIKERLCYEIRKCLHYLSWVWAVALVWHAPSRIKYLIGIPALVYLADYLVGMFMRNNLIENVYFERYGENGVAVHIDNPSGYNSSKVSYVYIMCPWISKWVSETIEL